MRHRAARLTGPVEEPAHHLGADEVYEYLIRTRLPAKNLISNTNVAEKGGPPQAGCLSFRCELAPAAIFASEMLPTQRQSRFELQGRCCSVKHEVSNRLVAPTLFAALPGYFGGKRRLCALIFALLDTAIPRAEWPGLTLIDPFLGGGSVSLFAKLLGFRVLSNDVALRSAAIGRALIANGTVTLEPADLAVLLRRPGGAYPQVARERYSPAVFSHPHANLLDRALFNLRGLDEPTRSLAILLVVKGTLRMQPMSQLRGTDARAAYEGDLDRVSPRRLGHYMNSGRLLRAEAWLGLAEQINSAVFPGRGEAFQADALAFLRAIEGDVAYLDPPYPGTASYEREYAVLDDLFEGAVRPVSPFSRSPDALYDLFSACDKFPIWLVSLNNAAIGPDELGSMVRRHKPHVRIVQIPYRHLGSIATEVKNAENREFIVLATD